MPVVILRGSRHQIQGTKIKTREGDIIKPCESCKSIDFDFVPPRGTIDPYVYVVGEAPGEEEQKQKKPFVGRSGKILEGVLKRAGFIYQYRIFNAVACRPTTTINNRLWNRTPTVKEVRLCSQYLKEDIRCHRPAVILTVGKSALKALEPDWADKQMMVLRKCKIQWEGIPLKVTYHPAYVLRKGGLSSEIGKEFEEDIYKLKEWVLNF